MLRRGGQEETAKDDVVAKVPGAPARTQPEHKAGPVRLAGGTLWFRSWAGRLGSLLPIPSRPVRALPQPQQGELALSLGAADFLAKPVTQHALLTALRRHLRRSPLADLAP